MYGNILTQRFNHFIINAHKNYSSLADKPFLEEMNKLNLHTEGVELFALTRRNLNLIGNPGRMLDLRPRESRKKNTNFFYSGGGDYMTVRIEPYFDSKNTYVTTNERHLREHYNNPFSEVSTHIFERTITLTDEFLSIRFNRYVKTRDVNCKYFRRNSMVYGIKMNLKTGNFITYRSDGTKRTKVLKARQNNFKHLYEVLDSIFRFRILFDDKRNGENLEKLFKTEVNDEVFHKSIHSTLSLLLNPSDDVTNLRSIEDSIQFTMESIIKLFVKIKNIKVPNNYFNYMIHWYPTKKYLVKNENKLIAAILDRMGIKSKSLVKLLHKIPNANLYNLAQLIKYFGYEHIHKFLPNINEKYITSSLRKDLGVINFSFLENQIPYHLSLNEKTKLLKLLNSLFDNEDSPFDEESNTRIITSQLNQIDDHLSMLEKIKVYLPDTELKSENVKTFHHEHIEYSKLYRSIQKGYSIQYTFEKRLIEHIEDVVISRPFDEGSATLFYPVILKTDGEYSEEGSHMHHCVATYADKEQSLIISIRKDDPFGTERVTCEFDVRSKNLVQAKSFCNAKPPEEFEFAIDKLILRIDLFRGSIKSTGKEKVPLVINGVEIKSPETRSSIDFLMDEINNYQQRQNQLLEF